MSYSKKVNTYMNAIIINAKRVHEFEREQERGGWRCVGSFGGRKEKEKITSKYKRNNF